MFYYVKYYLPQVDSKYNCYVKNYNAPIFLCIAEERRWEARGGMFTIYTCQRYTHLDENTILKGVVKGFKRYIRRRQ